LTVVNGGEIMPFTIRFALLAAAAAFVTAAQAAEVPTLDVSPTCRPLGGDVSLQVDTDRCFRSEREAREQLTRDWANFTAADQRLCTQTATMGGTASYVQLITCLELKRAAAKLPPDGGLTTRPSSLQGKP
jgi:hypothetical protein